MSHCFHSLFRYSVWIQYCFNFFLAKVFPGTKYSLNCLNQREKKQFQRSFACCIWCILVYQTKCAARKCGHAPMLSAHLIEPPIYWSNWSKKNAQQKMHHNTFSHVKMVCCSIMLSPYRTHEQIIDVFTWPLYWSSLTQTTTNEKPNEKKKHEIDCHVYSSRLWRRFYQLYQMGQFSYRIFSQRIRYHLICDVSDISKNLRQIYCCYKWTKKRIDNNSKR